MEDKAILYIWNQMKFNENKIQKNSIESKGMKSLEIFGNLFNSFEFR